CLKVVLWDTFQEDVKNVPIHQNDITVEYLITAPELRPAVTSEAAVTVAIIDNVFKSLTLFLRKQELYGSFELGGSHAPGIIG
ncbi:unnamed protein product, partial [Rotaria sp. Silwood1]